MKAKSSFCQRLSAALLIAFAMPAFCQEAVVPQGSKPFAADSAYLLGAHDTISVRMPEAENLNGTMELQVRITPDGFISLPMVGRLHVANLAIEKVEGILTELLKAYYKEPSVSLSVLEYRSQPVSVLGMVMNPGVIQLQGKKSLVEVISLAGGLKPEASSRIKITRKKEHGVIPLPGAAMDPTSQFMIGEVNLRSIIEARNPELNIFVQTDDIITVPRADVIYVLGDVQKPGSVVLNDQESISVMQIISLSGGLLKTASAKDSRILRSNPGATRRTEIPLDIKMIYDRKADDIALLPDDILFVPSSMGKKAVLRTLEALATAGTSMLGYGIINH
jgi:polysaccharide biosynthesis/export protein